MEILQPKAPPKQDKPKKVNLNDTQKRNAKSNLLRAQEMAKKLGIEFDASQFGL